jgi:hypothetical protein
LCLYCGNGSSVTTDRIMVTRDPTDVLPHPTTAPPWPNTLPSTPSDPLGPHGGLCACPQCVPRVTCDRSLGFVAPDTSSAAPTVCGIS